MTPEIALDLSLDGIAVLSRAPEGPDRGKWYRDGLVRLDAPDMAPRLRALRARCAARLGDDFTTILIIPDSQILFTSIERDDRDPKVTIRSQLAGRTPYPVEDLTFDHAVRGDRLQVAVVAIETLREAETFAADFGFRPVALVAAPKDASFTGLPHFGPTGIARELLAGGRLDLDLGRGFEIVDRPPAADAVTPAEAPSEPPAPAGPKDEGRSFADLVSAAPVSPRPPLPVASPDPPPRAPSAPVAVAAPVVSDATPARAEPAFASRRKAPASGDGARGEAAPRLPAPRMAATAAPPPRAGAAAGDPGDAVGEGPTDEALETATAEPPATAADEPPAKTADEPPATAEARPPPSRATAPPRRPAALDGSGVARRAPSGGRIAAAGRLGVLAARMRSTEPGPARPVPVPRASPMAADGALSEAQALSLPGIGRGRAARTSGRSGGRLGLWLTLSLLGLLALVAAWAVLFLPEDGPVDSAAPAATLAPSLRGDAAGDATEMTDIALLLPEPGTGTAWGGRSDASGLVAPPLPSFAASPDALAAGVDAAPPEEEGTGLALPEAADPEPLPGLGAIDRILTPGTEAAPPLGTFSTRGRFDAAPRLGTPTDPPDGSEIYLASIDPAVADGDAVALPRSVPPTDAFSPQTVPAPAGTAFPTGADGVVVPTAAGALAPGGYRVVTGRPAVMPQPRADFVAAAGAAVAPETAERLAEMRRVRPVMRPGDAAERVPLVALSGLSRAEITRTRPTPRPEAILAIAAARDGAVAAAEVAVAEAEAEQNAAVQAATASAAASLARPADLAVAPDDGPLSRYALAASDRPRERPRGVERAAAQIVTARRESPAAAAPAPQSTPRALPGAADAGRQTVRSAGGSVARAATETNAIALREINLIGVYGQPSNRRALVRLGNGRYVKVQVGDQLDRGRVTAIGESEVVYQRGGRNVALRMPRT